MLQMIQVHESEIILGERRKLNEPARFVISNSIRVTSVLDPFSKFYIWDSRDYSEYFAVTITT